MLIQGRLLKNTLNQENSKCKNDILDSAIYDVKCSRGKKNVDCYKRVQTNKIMNAESIVTVTS